MSTELNDEQYNELCANTMALFGLTHVNDAALVVNLALNVRDYVAATAGDQGDYVEGEAGFDDQGGDFADAGDGFDDQGGDFADAGDGFDDGQGGAVDDFTDAGDGFDDGQGDFGGDADLAFDDQAGGDDFAGFDDQGGDTEFGLGGDADFNFEEPAAPAPAPRQAARPAARPAVPAGNSRPAAAPAAQGRRPAAPAPAAAAPGRRPAAPAPAAPAGNSRQQQRPAPAAPAPRQQQAAPAAGDNYDAMKQGDLVAEIKTRGISAHAKGITGDKVAAYKALLRKFDKKVEQVSARYSVEQLEAQSKKAGLDVKYGRGRATDERKKSMHAAALIAANVVKL